MPKGIKITLLKVVFTTLLLYLFVARTDLNGILTVLSRLSVKLVLALGVLNVLGVLVNAYKWKMLLPEAKFGRLTAACFASYYFALLLPGQLAQEGSKVYYLRRGAMKMHRIAASVLVDKAVSTIGLLVIGCIGLSLSKAHLPMSLTWIFVASGLLAIALLFSLGATWVYSQSRRALQALRDRFHKRTRVVDSFEGFFESWHYYARNPLLLSSNVLAAVLYQSIGVLMLFLLSHGLGMPIGFFDWCWMLTALTLALFLPLTVAGLGVREGTLIGVLGMFEYPRETAIAFSLTAFAFVIMLAIIGGVVCLTVKSPRELAS